MMSAHPGGEGREVTARNYEWGDGKKEPGMGRVSTGADSSELSNFSKCPSQREENPANAVFRDPQVIMND